MAYLGVGYSLVVLFEGFYAWLTSLSFESLLIVAASRSLHVILNYFSLLSYKFFFDFSTQIWWILLH